MARSEMIPKTKQERDEALNEIFAALKCIMHEWVSDPEELRFLGQELDELSTRSFYLANKKLSQEQGS